MASGRPERLLEAPMSAKATRLPGGLLGMTVLIVAIEATIARHDLDLKSPATASWTLSARAALVEAPRCQVLLLGDSMIKHALLPPVLEARLGTRAYNLSVCAAQAPATYYLLRRALDAGAKPTSLVVEFSPDLMAGNPSHLERNWPELLDFPERVELARVARRPALLASLTLNGLLPSVRCRHEIRPLVAAMRGESVSPRAANILYARNWALNRGAQYTPKNPLFRGDVTPDEQRRLGSDRWWCSQVNKVYIRKLLDLASSRRIPLYWLLPPVAPQLQAIRDQSGSDTRHVTFLRALQALYPELVVLDARRSGYGSSLFQDPLHLDGEGALALSRTVADVLSRRPDSAWVALPSFRPTRPDLPLEDVDQSRMALERAGVMRR